MSGQKILIISHEMAPYTDITAQSDFIRDLALYLQRKGAEIRVFMPKFGSIKERKHRLHEVIRLSGLNITIGRENNPLVIKVASLQTAKIQVYFLDNEEFFQRKEYFYDENGKFFKDNDDRMIFFNKGSMELLIKLGWIPNIIHCQGWMSSLIPYYSRTTYKNEPAVRNSKIIYSVFDDGFHHNLGANFNQKAHMKTFDDSLEYMKKPDTNELYKLGVKYADNILISSEKYDPAVSDYIKNEGKNFLVTTEHPDEEFYEKYSKIISG